MYKPGYTEWNKLEKNWLQKIFIDPTGHPVFTYHYKTKTGRSCGVIEIDTKISNRACGLKLIEKDIRDSKVIFNEYEKIMSFIERSTLLVFTVKNEQTSPPTNFPPP